MIQNKLFRDCLAAIMPQLKRYSMQHLEAKNAYKYHINIVNYSLISLKCIKNNGINLFKKKNTRNFAAAH